MVHIVYGVTYLRGSVWHVYIKIQHRGHIKRLFNPIIQQAAVQKADAGKQWALCAARLLSFPSSHTPLSLSLLSLLPQTTHCLLPLHSQIPPKPTFDSRPPCFFHTLAMTVLSVNIHCFQTGPRQPYNHIIAQTKPPTKPLLSAACVISDTCRFYFTRALCHISNLMQTLIFIKHC